MICNQNLLFKLCKKDDEVMIYDVIIIGGGLSGLTSASLLAKRGLKVAVVDKSYNPGGSCGIFKRNSRIYDQGSAMLYGFGENGFNAHRFVMNCLEEPIDMIKHDLLYCVNYEGKRVQFWPNIDDFIKELTTVFPHEEKGIRRFYHDMNIMYQHVMVERPSYSSADETNPKTALKSMMKHPISYIRFLSYLNKSAKSLLKKYFNDPEIFNFFDKLTSTYCYATVEEAPAVLASVMFVDNHVGGSYYPAGSTLFLPGKLEKVIEEHQGDMYLESEVVSILFTDNQPSGVLLKDGRKLEGKYIVYTGTVWNLYSKLIDEKYTSRKQRNWALKQEPTYPSMVLYTIVDKSVIPFNTAAIEMLVGNPKNLDESEVTAYILSVDDRTLCQDDEHIVMAIGPSFENWDNLTLKDYRAKKEKEKERLIGVLEKRFPGFKNAIRHSEVATPKTIERYTLKNGGAVAGPKQMLGQHLFKRQHIKSKWSNLVCAGESTVMGTGTPTVTTSGISAANVILKQLNLEPFVYQKNQTNYVNIVEKPVTFDNLYSHIEQPKREIMFKAMKCQFCEHPLCSKGTLIDIRGIMRRAAVGNMIGAKKIYNQEAVDESTLENFEHNCIQNKRINQPVEIKKIFDYLNHLK